MHNMNDVTPRDSRNGCNDVLSRTQEGAINRAAICRSVPQIAGTLDSLESLTASTQFYVTLAVTERIKLKESITQV